MRNVCKCFMWGEREDDMNAMVSGGVRKGDEDRWQIKIREQMSEENAAGPNASSPINNRRD